jgi:hypothetical protein
MRAALQLLGCGDQVVGVDSLSDEDIFALKKARLAGLT